ncbi:tRNA1(Val) (adenine(37)-N6)-methyltransferase [Oceanicaulis sp. LC35]|uniref:tRNA1(Val) (adenine(37)-N6)-methyltransferase n=1 Tax=Oceanicaulis sp. LC35 TaxID=3349635 RepID=UPI003F851316
MTRAPDAFLGGKISLYQLEDGYRAGMDAAVLVAGLNLKPGQRAMEFGCGVGAALLGAAALYDDVELIGVEIDPKAAALAQDNIVLNDMADRVRITEGDALVYPDARELDAVFFNPPFFDDPSALRAPKPGKTPAWMSDAGLAAWIDTGLRRLRSGGVITVIQRADRLDDILIALKNRAGSVKVLPLQSRAGEPAKRVLVQAIKTGKAPLQLHAPLILHAAGESGFTEQADAIFKGEARLEFHR